MPLKKLTQRIDGKRDALKRTFAARRAQLQARIGEARAFAADRIEFGVRKFREYRTIAFLPENARFFAAAAYVPFVGWMLPLYLKEDSSFCQESGKQGFVLAVFFAAIPMALSLLGVLFVPKDARIVSLVLAILVYLSNSVYLVLCVISAFMAIRTEKLLAVPVAASYAQRLQL